MFKNFLILGLISVIVGSLLWPAPGRETLGVQYGTLGVTQLAIVVFFVISGLCLDSISDCMQPKALGVGSVLVLFVTPVLAWPIMALLKGKMDLALLQGLALFCVVPTTLSSGVQMVTMAKGNVSLAVLLTTVTNIAGIFTMPWSTSWIFLASVTVSPLDMLVELTLLTLLPLIVGIVLRRVEATGLKQFAKANKSTLSLIQNTSVLVVVWLMVSGAQHRLKRCAMQDLWISTIIVTGAHMVFLAVSYVFATAAQLPHREWVTIVLISSQKSLSICVSVLAVLPPGSGAGMMIIPCIIGHAAQLIIDSIWSVRTEDPTLLVPLSMQSEGTAR